jgi:hypothetical protein
MSLKASPRNCLYTHRPNGIHEYIFLNNGRKTFDEYTSYLERYIAGVSRGEIQNGYLAILIELREPGMPPIAYMASRYYDLLVKYPGRLPDARIAFVHREGLAISIIRTFLSLLPNRNTIERRFFYMHERDEAERWLLEVIEPAANVK